MNRRLSSALLLLTLGACSDLPVQVAGCDGVLAGPVCELDPGKELRLFLPQGRLGAVPLILSLEGRGALAIRPQQVEDGLLLRLRPRRSFVIIDRQGLRVRARRVHLHPVSTAPWLLEARKQWEADQQEAAEARLRAGLAGELPLEQRAEALGMLGRIRRERHAVPEAAELLTQALAADQAAGRLSAEGKDALALASLRLLDQGRIPDAEAVLDARAQLFQQLPDLQPWVLLQKAAYRTAEGSFPAALEAAEEAKLHAARIDDAAVLRTLRQSAASSLEALGRYREARDELKALIPALEGPDGSPCLLAYALENAGLVEVLDAEARGVHGRPPAQDPQLPLQRALALRQRQCRQVGPMAATQVKLARAALLRGRTAEAAAHLGQAEALVPAPDGELQRHLIELHGHVALAAGRPIEALLRYDALQGLADAGARADADDSRYRALIGQARGLAALGQLAAAEARFLQAEGELERRARALPLGEGRVSYLGRHEQGAAAHLELLLDQGRTADAMGVLRRTRRRGLQDLTRLRGVAALPAAQRPAWEAGVREHERLLLAIDALVQAERLAPLDQLPILRAQQRRLERALARSFEGAVQVLPAVPDPAPRAPAAGELLLACHPLTRGSVCLTQGPGAAVHALRLPGPLDAAGATAWLHSLAPVLRQSQRLTVLSYGDAMDRIDLQGLPLDGQPLGDRLEVAYALDVPRPAAPPRPGPVLLALDPAAAFPIPEVPVLAPLRAAPQLLATARGQDGQTRWLREHLAQAALLVYFGHAVFTPQVLERRLQTDRGGGLRVTDILVAPGAPDAVVLIGCGTGAATEQSGGGAGLGVAQAFLLRGAAFVLATVRDVSPELGRAMAEELLRAGAGALRQSPAERLRSARQAVVRVKAERARDVDAFRLLVP